MEDLLDTSGKKSFGYFLSMVHSKPTDSWWNRFENGLVSVAGYMVLYVTGLVVVDVIMRYFLNDPLNSSTVTAEIVMTTIVVLAGPWLHRENGWVKIDLITSKLKGAQAHRGVCDHCELWAARPKLSAACGG